MVVVFDAKLMKTQKEIMTFLSNEPLIEAEITRAFMNRGNMIRIPVHIFDQRGKFFRASRRLAQEYGREPTEDELARVLEWPHEEVRRMLTMVDEPLRLEEPIGDGDDASERGDLIPDTNLISPSEAAFECDVREQIRRVLSYLTPREEYVIRKRFGIGFKRPYTLEETAEEIRRTFKFSRERVRQIEAEALGKLRGIMKKERLILDSFLNH